jgi:hypothetical protein
MVCFDKSQTSRTTLKAESQTRDSSTIILFIDLAIALAKHRYVAS